MLWRVGMGCFGNSGWKHLAFSFVSFFFCHIYRVEKEKKKILNWIPVWRSAISRVFRIKVANLLLYLFVVYPHFFFFFLLSGINGFSQFDFFHEKKCRPLMKNPVIPAQSTTKKKMQKTYVDKKKGERNKTSWINQSKNLFSYLFFFCLFCLILKKMLKDGLSSDVDENLKQYFFVFLSFFVKTKTKICLRMSIKFLRARRSHFLFFFSIPLNH